MIRYFYGKLFKKLFIISLISCFCLLGSSFVDSAFVVHNNAEYFPSTLDSSIDLNVFNKGQLGSQRFGQTKRLLAFSSNRDTQGRNSRIYFFWGYNQKPYYFVQMYGYFYQGFLKKYKICDQLTGGFTGTINDLHCSNHDITDNFVNEVGGLFDSMTSYDTWGYDIHTWNCYGDTYLVNQVCFSSLLYHKSICFGAGGGDSNSTLCVCSDCKNTNGASYIFSGQDFTSVPDYMLNTPPGFQPISTGNIQGSSNTSQNVDLTGNLLYNKCTKGYILNKLNGVLGSQFCYAGTYDTGIIDNNFNGNTYIYNSGLKYRDLYKLSKSIGPYYSSYNDWYIGHYDNIKRFKLGQISQNPFIGEPVAVYSYFNYLFSNYGFDSVDLTSKEWSSYGVLNYCNLLFSDSSNDSDYTGQYFQYLCDSLNYSDGSTNITTGEVGDIDDDEILPPGFDNPDQNTSSGVAISVDWSGTLSGNTNQNFEGKTFINDFYQKLQSVFQKPINSATGIIPGYILVFLVAIILFRFIQH